MNKNDQEFLVQTIRSRYMEKESTELDALCALDRKVKRPANVFAYCLGGLGAIVMGAGMSLVMTDLGGTLGIAEPMLAGIVIGLAGMLLAILNIPLHRSILRARQKKYAQQILALSEKIMKG